MTPEQHLNHAARADEQRSRLYEILGLEPYRVDVPTLVKFLRKSHAAAKSERDKLRKLGDEAADIGLHDKAGNYDTQESVAYGEMIAYARVLEAVAKGELKGDA